MIPARPDSIARAARSGEAVPRASRSSARLAAESGPTTSWATRPAKASSSSARRSSSSSCAEPTARRANPAMTVSTTQRRVQHDGVDDRLAPQLADGAPELPAASGVEVDEAQNGGVEAVGRRLQLLLQHGADLGAIGVVLDQLEPRDGRRQILLAPSAPRGPARPRAERWAARDSCSNRARAR